MLHENGVDALILDCDGNVEELLPIWVDIGINALYPIEIAAGNDPIKIRKKFGNNLINKILIPGKKFFSYFSQLLFVFYI